MRTVVTSPDHAAGIALLARLLGLLRDVEEINQQLERIETEMQQAFNAEARERFEEYR